MGKIVKFQKNNNREEKNTKKDEKLEKVKSFGFTDFEISLRESIENYIKSVFAVKEILGMDIVFKENNRTIGVIGVISYEHKRRPGILVADFISKCTLINNDIKVNEVAFQAGEPDLYRQIFNILKAKKALPDIVD